ncbi:hypothetical protein SAY87_025223 [Trapa incisa]|uniref:Uncharacterized protein n=1 Tax=Trapa incisa TaxID=236973 RepID=A0AAN7GAK9_9MYRT|nr:hypothetical protein SAY87_025223 [Trapa incisa]
MSKGLIRADFGCWSAGSCDVHSFGSAGPKPEARVQEFASGSLDEDVSSVRLFVARGIELIVIPQESGSHPERIGAINLVCSSAEAAAAKCIFFSRVTFQFLKWGSIISLFLWKSLFLFLVVVAVVAACCLALKAIMD